MGVLLVFIVRESRWKGKDFEVGYGVLPIKRNCLIAVLDFFNVFEIDTIKFYVLGYMSLSTKQKELITHINSIPP